MNEQDREVMEAYCRDHIRTFGGYPFSWEDDEGEEHIVADHIGDDGLEDMAHDELSGAFSLVIDDTANAAFGETADERNVEIAQTIRRACDLLKHRSSGPHNIPRVTLRDEMGNTVGMAAYVYDKARDYKDGPCHLNSLDGQVARDTAGEVLLTIKTGNAAFDLGGNPSQCVDEITRILHKAAEHIEEDGVDREGVKLYDYNGNAVGWVRDNGPDNPRSIEDVENEKKARRSRLSARASGRGGPGM